MNSDSANSDPQTVIPSSKNSMEILKPYARNCLVSLISNVQTVYIQVESGSPPPKVVIVIEGEQTVLYDPAVPIEKK